jgi:hypothetical protein
VLSASNLDQRIREGELTLRNQSSGFAAQPSRSGSSCNNPQIQDYQVDGELGAKWLQTQKFTSTVVDGSRRDGKENDARAANIRKNALPKGPFPKDFAEVRATFNSASVMRNDSVDKFSTARRAGLVIT